MVRYALLFAVAFFLRNAYATEDETAQKPANTEININESVVHLYDLPTHMGWETQEAVFRTPRNFRSQRLNEMHLDSEDDAPQPITDNR